MTRVTRTPIVWSNILDLTPTECQRKLRSRELMAYSMIVSVFRAQGGLSIEKRNALAELRKILRVNIEAHRAEIRRAINDEELTTICESLTGNEITEEWIQEGKRIAPILDKPLTLNKDTDIASTNAAEHRFKNASFRHPVQKPIFSEQPKGKLPDLRPPRKRELSDAFEPEEVSFKKPLLHESKAPQNGQFRKPEPVEYTHRTPFSSRGEFNKMSAPLPNENLEPKLYQDFSKDLQSTVGLKKMPPSLSLKKPTDSPHSMWKQNAVNPPNSVAKVFMRSPMLNRTASGFNRHTSSSLHPMQSVSYVSSVSSGASSANTSVINRYTSTVQAATTSNSKELITAAPELSKPISNPKIPSVTSSVPSQPPLQKHSPTKVAPVTKILQHPQSSSNVYYVHKPVVSKPNNGITAFVNDPEKLVPDLAPSINSSKQIQIINTRSANPPKTQVNTPPHAPTVIKITSSSERPVSLNSKFSSMSQSEAMSVRSAPFAPRKMEIPEKEAYSNSNGNEKEKEMITVQLPEIFNRQSITVPIVNSNVDMDDPEWEENDDSAYNPFLIEGRVSVHLFSEI
ncbi:hypothetical protein Ciccas_007499 [Cichlidogyrus casuarinus]|uniref:ENT domain-containing protein n=1 Tax=Cichlidogyrus casuarinus TaxID=1844966 RepID=A0ABD2Q2P2_9PLAT